MGQKRLGPSYFFISLVLVPLNSLVWYVPSLRYARGLGWRIHCGVEVTESSTNKQHIIITVLETLRNFFGPGTSIRAVWRHERAGEGGAAS